MQQPVRPGWFPILTCPAAAAGLWAPKWPGEPPSIAASRSGRPASQASRVHIAQLLRLLLLPPPQLDPSPLRLIAAMPAASAAGGATRAASPAPSPAAGAPELSLEAGPLPLELPPLPLLLGRLLCGGLPWSTLLSRACRITLLGAREMNLHRPSPWFHTALCRRGQGPFMLDVSM